MGTFAQITAGPASTTGNNPNKQALIFDRANNITESVGDAGIATAEQTALAVANAQSALSNVTTAQTAYTANILSGGMNKLRRMFEILGSGVYTSPGATTPTITVQIVLGGVTLCAIVGGPINTTASTNMPFNFAFTLSVVSTGTAGTIESHGYFNINTSANTPAAAIQTFNDTNTAVSSAVNLVTSPLALLVQFAASSTVTSITLRQLQINVIN